MANPIEKELLIKHTEFLRMNFEKDISLGKRDEQEEQGDDELFDSDE